MEVEMNTTRFLMTCLTALAVAPAGIDASAPLAHPRPSVFSSATLLVSGLAGASGSTVGPDGALYVTEGALGRVTRVDPATGAVSTFASGLPPSIVGLGGAIDVAFISKTAYVLVTLVGPDVGGSNVVGIYRVDGPTTVTPIADIGAFALANPPPTAFDVPTGLQFALEPYRHGFLVTDGHHNRVLRVSLDGTISVFRQFGNIVPTGLAISDAGVFMAEAGPVPHLREDGKVVLMSPVFAGVLEWSGAPLLVDVEFGRGERLYALSQGKFPVGEPPATPALPNTGALVQVKWDGSLRVVAAELNLPTSLEFVHGDAYVVTLTGEIWRIELLHP
jgi:sugar lactone lactonase YvrE